MVPTKSDGTAAVSPETRLRLSMAQMGSVILIVCGVFGSIIFSAMKATEWKTNLEHELLDLHKASAAAMKNIAEMRQDFNESMNMIREMDNDWKSRVANLAVEIKSDRQGEYSSLSGAVEELRAAIPTEFPPRLWLENTYYRDRDMHKKAIDDLRAQIEAIEERVPPQ